VLKNVKSPAVCDRFLQGLHLLILEFNNLAALGADEVVMMMPEVAVLISGRLAFKLLFLGEPEIHPSIHALPDKAILIIVPSLLQPLHDFFKGQVVLRIQKHVDDVEPHVRVLQAVRLDEGSEILFFKMTGHP